MKVLNQEDMIPGIVSEEVSLDELKLFMRVDGNEEDMLILSLVGIAEEYLYASASIPRNYDVKLYKFAIHLITNHWFENRSAIGKVDGALEYSLKSILFLLKYGGIYD